MNRRSISYLVVTAACLSLGSLSVVAGQADHPGDLWQVTPQMSMAGMVMPLPPQSVCSPKQWTRPPAGSGPDPSCVNSDFMMSDTNTATWRVTCQAPPSTGVGQITRMGAEAWSGSIVFTSAQGQITINLTGRRVDGCDNPVQ